MGCDPLWYDILFLPFFLLICLATLSKILQWTCIPSEKKKSIGISAGTLKHPDSEAPYRERKPIAV